MTALSFVDTKKHPVTDHHDSIRLRRITEVCLTIFSNNKKVKLCKYFGAIVPILGQHSGAGSLV